MDRGIDNVFIIHEDLLRAVDQAVWMNFMQRAKDIMPFSVIESRSGEFAVVSDDVLEFFDDLFIHPLHGDYLDMTMGPVRWIGNDPQKLEHWAEIYDAFANMKTDVLIFILLLKVPLEMFIRAELIFREKDQNNEPCTKDKAESIWNQ